jgi:DNA invertase Pin-like site-specific DNA recombinase
MRAMIYCRVLTKDQTIELSLPTQVKACEAYCERQGMNVVEVFVDAGETSTDNGR